MTPANGHSANGEHTNENGQHKAGSFGVLLEEAQSLQNTLRDMLLRTNQLITGLKQYHRQTKTMRSTLASLRQLQQLEVYDPLKPLVSNPGASFDTRRHTC